MENISTYHYCDSLVSYQRRKTREVNMGHVPLGGNNPIRLQSMTTVDAMDTEGTIQQSIRLVKAGCEYVRIAVPSIKEAKNLSSIKKRLIEKGYSVPLIADIHFTPNAAEYAAKVVEKIRINPGNYADKKQFKQIDYTDLAYQHELNRVRDKFIPLVHICKDHGTVMRIGVNHGSLSDRIMSRFGDTPLGMVESALEFLRICEALNYYDIVLSMKASNPQVMVHAYRLLVHKLIQEKFQPYPLHLGVTEAGLGEEGRIKSAIGIGVLLEDGLGDTVRVSLTEDPEYELPVAKMLVDRYVNRQANRIPPIDYYPLHPFEYRKRYARKVVNFGGKEPPRVIADLSFKKKLTKSSLSKVGYTYSASETKWVVADRACDYLYVGYNTIDFTLPDTLTLIYDQSAWVNHKNRDRSYPLITSSHYLKGVEKSSELNFVHVRLKELSDLFIEAVEQDNTVVLLVDTTNDHAMAEYRRFFIALMNASCEVPVVIMKKYEKMTWDKLIVHASTDTGGLFLEGLGDGLFISSQDHILVGDINKAVFSILQATRTRLSKAAYIACPSCGRTLFSLQDTTEAIQAKTNHLKGIKIGIMGCIVNGPGEMADADYGYVGSGLEKINLYRGQEMVKRNVSSDKAVDELIRLIEEDGRWVNP